jgi:hypothetical protein
MDNERVFLGVTLVVALGAFPAPASCQAAAESVLLGAASSTATVKAGSALNSALNQSSKQLAGRIQQQLPQAKTPHSQPHGAPKAQAARSAAYDNTKRGSLIASIEGARPNCAASNKPTLSVEDKPAHAPAQPSCASQNNSESGSTIYKSVITLSSPK